MPGGFCTFIANRGAGIMNGWFTRKNVAQSLSMKAGNLLEVFPQASRSGQQGRGKKRGSNSHIVVDFPVILWAVVTTPVSAQDRQRKDAFDDQTARMKRFLDNLLQSNEDSLFFQKANKGIRR